MRSAASLDSPPVLSSSTRSSLPGATLASSRRGRPRGATRIAAVEMIELADRQLAHHRDDLGMAVAEDGAHLARGEIEDAAARRHREVVALRALRRSSAEVAAVADQMRARLLPEVGIAVGCHDALLSNSLPAVMCGRPPFRKGFCNISLARRGAVMFGLFVRRMMCRWPRWIRGRVLQSSRRACRAMTAAECSRSGMPTDFAISRCLSLRRGWGVSRRLSRRLADGWRAIGLVVGEHGPQDAGGAGGRGNGDDLAGSPRHHAAQPRRGLLGVSLGGG